MDYLGPDFKTVFDSTVKYFRSGDPREPQDKSRLEGEGFGLPNDAGAVHVGSQ